MRANMSLDGTELLFEGFLQKRKDTMKLRWTTYWFRLHNTTLFFYTKKNGDASHLRGYYYIYTVQSVREVQRADSKRFMFEIIMTNGKRKMLAAETAVLRKEWVDHLWTAMYLSTSAATESGSTCMEMPKQQTNGNRSLSMWDGSESGMDMLPVRPISTPAPSVHIHHESWIAPPTSLSQELNIEQSLYENTLLTCEHQDQNDTSCQTPLLSGDSLNSPHWSSGLNTSENRQEGDYDVLPLRNKICESSASADMEEGVYDFPISYRRVCEHPDPTESIYDIPSSLLRTASDNLIEEQEQEEMYWTISGQV